MKSNGISEYLVPILLILLPLTVADGFKDHQLKLGYDNGEYRLLKWLNKIRGSDRTSSQSESQFEPIKTDISTPEIQYNTSNFTQTQLFDAPQLAKATYSSVPQSPDDKSSSKSSLDSVEAQETRPLVTSLFSPSYRDYFYLKWFHGSPKATYFNETAVPDKPIAVLDSKAEHGHNPTDEAILSVPKSPVAITNQEFDVENIDFSDAESALVSSDSLLGRVLGKIKQMMPVKTQKLDYRPLKFYDEPPKPQFNLPKAVHFPPILPLPSNIQQVHSQPIREVIPPVVPVQPVYNELSSANSQSPQQAVISTTENNQSQLGETSTSAPEPIVPSDEDSKPQPAEPSSSPVQPNLPSIEDSKPQLAEPSPTPASYNSTSDQPEPKDSISERMSVHLPPMFYYPKRANSNPAQLEEPAYSSLELAFSPLVPAYP